MKTKLLSGVVLCVILAFASCSSNEHDEILNNNNSNLGVVDELASVEGASFIYDQLMKSFLNTSELRSGELKLVQYPEYYGGSYIDDKGEFVVYVNEDGSKELNARSSITTKASSNNIIYKNAKYSYNYLNSIMDELNEYVIANINSSVVSNIDGFYLSDSENSIIVELDNCNEDKVNEFKNNFANNSSISFKKSAGKLINHVNVNCGEQITDGTYGASMGYRAKVGTEEGIVTAGHFAGVGTAIRYNGVIMGSCTKSQNSGSVDAAFCKITNKSYTPTNEIAISSTTTRTLSTTISEPGVGTTINMKGATTGSKSGKIVSINASAKVGSVVFTNLTSVDLASSPGDSGGLCFSYVSSTGMCYTLGINKGASGSTAYYSKANQVNKQLGTIRY